MRVSDEEIEEMLRIYSPEVCACLRELLRAREAVTIEPQEVEDDFDRTWNDALMSVDAAMRREEKQR